MGKLYLGVDTSCYTTSVAAVDETGEIILNIKRPLAVAQGDKGLMQSRAVFLHLQNAIELFGQNKIREYGEVCAVCASSRPRPQEGSYMPVFRVSECFGHVVASVTGAQLFLSTHQEGHIAAALVGMEDAPERFLAAHVSGGTTELLDVRCKAAGYDIEIVGKTKDIAAGQLIDRVGQQLGMAFPSGPAMEACTQEAEGSYKISVAGSDFNFSGVEAQAKGDVEKGTSAGEVCGRVFDAVSRTLAGALKNAVKDTGVDVIILFGGVMSNGMIRESIGAQVAGARFARKEYAPDNAVGLAMLARKQMEDERGSTDH